MKPAKKPHGEIRQSQLITTFGPGSMLDLPNYSVLVAGLEFWSAGGETISEPRLSRKLARVLEVNSVELKTPPPANDDPGAATTGITGFQFPEWFITQGLEESKGGPSIRTRLLVHRKALTKGKYIDRDKKKKISGPCTLRSSVSCGSHCGHRLVLLCSQRAIGVRETRPPIVH